MIEYLSRTRDRDLAADVCVVGGGVAGITLALEFERTGAGVVLLEGGGRKVDGEQQRLYAGTVRGLPARPLVESRYRCLGGSSARWYGRCIELEEHDFARRPWVADSGWPFELEELRRYYDRAAGIVGIRRPRTGDPEENRLATSKLGSAHLAARWSDIRQTHFGLRYRRRLAASASVRVALEAQVLRIRASGRGWCLDVADVGGRQRMVAADRVVLAAGGIENPRLMLLSELHRGWPAGDCPIGSYFMDHAYLEGAEIRDYPPDIWRDFTLRKNRGSLAQLVLTDSELQRQRLTAGAAYLLPRFGYQERWDSAHPMRDLKEALTRHDVRSAASGLGPALRSIPGTSHLVFRRALERRRPAECLIFRSVVEQAPNRDNRVTLGGRMDRFGSPLPEVSWVMSERDTYSLGRFYDIVSEEFHALDLGRFEPRFDFEQTSWQRHIYSGRHHMGTTRMGTDPATSVVDADCRVHGRPGLYVAGSSVFPTYGWANPTLTIVALSVRLADHLAN